MNQLIWRLHRNQVLFAAAAIAALAVILLVTGITMANDYHAFLSTCSASQSCSDGRALFSGDGAIMDLVDLTIVVPLLFGLFWGAPLIAKEFEEGTHNLAWTQGVTRSRWLKTNIFWVFLAAGVWGGMIATLVSWWRFPENALGARFDAFDVQGIVPVAFSLFAVGLGITVGSIIRRVMPAIAVTLGVFVGVRVAIGVYLRPHYLAPLLKVLPLSASQGGLPGGAWIISTGIAGPTSQNLGTSLTPGELPAACQIANLGDKGSSLGCLASHGFRQLITYQPDDRFWAFQGIEAAIFLVLTVGLVGFAYWRVLSHDA